MGNQNKPKRLEEENEKTRPKKPNKKKHFIQLVGESNKQDSSALDKYFTLLEKYLSDESEDNKDIDCKMLTFHGETHDFFFMKNDLSNNSEKDRKDLEKIIIKNSINGGIIFVYDLKSTQFLNLIQSKFSKILSKKHEDEYQIREIMLLEIRDDNEPTNEDLHNIGKTLAEENNLGFNELNLDDNEKFREIIEKFLEKISVLYDTGIMPTVCDNVL